MMWRASAPAHFDPSARQYGMNWPGDFESLLRTSLLEAIVLWAVLRPWSFNSSSRRLGGAAALFTPYLGLRIMVGVHGGPIVAAHDLWLLFLWLGMLLSAGAVAWRSRRRAAEPGVAADRGPELQ
jgi:hypothetical protein